MRFRPAALAVALAITTLAAPARSQNTEDFESYVDTADLQAAWLNATALDESTPNPGAGTKSLRLEDTRAAGTGFASTATFDAPVDLSGLQVSFWVRRDPTSVAPTDVYVDLQDESFAGCDANSLLLSDSAWHRVILDVDDDCSGMDATAVVYVQVGAGNGTKSAGTVAVNYDDLSVQLFVGNFETGDTSRWSSVSPST